jgi:HTH-type transcriptional regulator/antitoxin HipB
MPTISTTQQLGAILANRRGHLKVTQTELGEKIGLSQNRLSVLERNPAALTARQLLALLHALGLEMTLGERAGKA